MWLYCTLSKLYYLPFVTVNTNSKYYITSHAKSSPAGYKYPHELILHCTVYIIKCFAGQWPGRSTGERKLIDDVNKSVLLTNWLMDENISGNIIRRIYSLSYWRESKTYPLATLHPSPLLLDFYFVRRVPGESAK